MLRSLFLSTVLVIACLVSATAHARKGIEIGEVRTIQSTVLGESRDLYVYLPPSYHQAHRYRRYPVLYVLDGEKFFHSFTGVVAQLSSDATPHTPEMIVIGIVGRDRVRDSSPTHSLAGPTGRDEAAYRNSGGGAAFQKFLRDELIPYVESEFSASDYRIYCGYSFTGLSTLDVLFSGSKLFDAYIAIDPSWWWDGYVMEARAKAALQTGAFDRTQLFIAASGDPYPENYFPDIRDISALADILKHAKATRLDWEFKRYDDESHHSMPMRALHDGLSYIFRGHQPSLKELYTDVAALRARYDALSARLGESVFPREDLVNSFGYQFLHGFKDTDKAIAYFRLNVDHFPGSANAWDSLAEAYSVSGDKAKAIEMYGKSLALNPDNQNARTQLRALGKSIQP